MISITCHGCAGKRKVAPLGGILKDCVICGGLGVLTNEMEVWKPVLDNMSTMYTNSTIDKPVFDDKIKALIGKKGTGKKIKGKERIARL
jgi:hypothetical protein